MTVNKQAQYIDDKIREIRASISALTSLLAKY